MRKYLITLICTMGLFLPLAAYGQPVSDRATDVDQSSDPFEHDTVNDDQDSTTELSGKAKEKFKALHNEFKAKKTELRGEYKEKIEAVKENPNLGPGEKAEEIQRINRNYHELLGKLRNNWHEKRNQLRAQLKTDRDLSRDTKRRDLNRDTISDRKKSTDVRTSDRAHDFKRPDSRINDRKSDVRARDNAGIDRHPRSDVGRDRR